MKSISRFAQAAVLSLSLALPLVGLAAAGINTGAITPYSEGIINLINDILVPVLMAVAFITFLWGIFKYFIWNADNETEKAEGRKFAMWGVIGFTIIISLWGLVNVFSSLLALSNQGAPPPPTIWGSTGSGGPAYFSTPAACVGEGRVYNPADGTCLPP